MSFYLELQKWAQVLDQEMLPESERVKSSPTTNNITLSKGQNRDCYSKYWTPAVLRVVGYTNI